MKCILSILAIILFSVPSIAQKTDFSGTWILKENQSISGISYPNGVPKQVKATPLNDRISIEKITTYGRGDVSTTETIKFDGSSFETLSGSKRKELITMKWSDDQKTFTESSNYYSTTDATKLDITVTDIWSIADGKLVIDRKSENFIDGEVYEMKGIYEKQ